MCCVLDNQFVTVICAVQSIQQLCFWLECQYNNCVVVWTISTATVLRPGWFITATVLWVGQSVQKLRCGLDIPYSKGFVF